MIDRSWAEAFAREWVASWNRRDLEALLGHYSPTVVFHSPRIADVLGGDKAFVTGIGELRGYWRQALERTPALHFELIEVLTGSDAVTIYYRNHRQQHVAETMVIGPDRKVTEAVVTYK